MAAQAKCIEIAPEDRPVQEKWANSRSAERRLVERAQIVLLAGEGKPASEIAERVGCVAETARRQRARYEREGLDGLGDRAKSGRPLTHGHCLRRTRPHLVRATGRTAAAPHDRRMKVK